MFQSTGRMQIQPTGPSVLWTCPLTGNRGIELGRFAALVRWCERTGMLERLSEMHPPGWAKRMQTTWGGKWQTTMRSEGRSAYQDDCCGG